jgi:hypothetical protein
MRNLLSRKRRVATKTRISNRGSPRIRGISRSNLSPPECRKPFRRLKVASMMK